MRCRYAHASSRAVSNPPPITVAFSYLVADSVKSGELIPLLQDFQPPPQPVSFVYSPNRFMPAKLRAFLDFAAPRVRARLSDIPKELLPPRTRQ